MQNNRNVAPLSAAGQNHPASSATDTQAQTQGDAVNHALSELAVNIPNLPINHTLTDDDTTTTQVDDNAARGTGDPANLDENGHDEDQQARMSDLPPPYNPFNPEDIRDLVSEALPMAVPNFVKNQLRDAPECIRHALNHHQVFYTNIFRLSSDDASHYSQCRQPRSGSREIGRKACATETSD